MEDFKITMEAARVNAGYTQQTVADKMGVTRQTIAAWENGKIIPRPSDFNMFCMVCKAPVDCVILPNT